jgi:DNA-binding Lrp family transcriptional regulator
VPFDLPLDARDGLDQVDRLILNVIQDKFPLAPRPYAALAERLNAERGLFLTEAEVIRRIESLKARRFVRRVGAIFNFERLGFRSTLCAARAPADKIDLFARLVSASPWVTHNYLRNDDLNVWFTFCYDQPERLREFFKYLEKESGISEIYEFPSQKIYKINAVFKLPE